MAASSSPRKSAPRKRLAPVAAHPAAPSGRFAALLNEVHVPDPYVITEQLVVEPPTRRQLADITAAQAAFAIASGQLRDLMTPRLVTVIDDVTGQPKVDDDGKTIQREQLPEVDPDYLERINQVVEQSADRYNRALFGDAYGQVLEFFDNRPAQEWTAFYEDIQSQFMPTPDTGRCPTCGHTDEEQAGKPIASTPS